MKSKNEKYYTFGFDIKSHNAINFVDDWLDEHVLRVVLNYKRIPGLFLLMLPKY